MVGREGEGGGGRGGVAGEAHCTVSHNRAEVGPTGRNHHLSVSVCVPVCSTACQPVTSLIVRLDKPAVKVLR